MSDLVKSACDLQQALHRVGTLRAEWYSWANSGLIAPPEVHNGLIEASEAVRVAITALSGSDQ